MRLVTVLLFAPSVFAASCESLQSLRLADTTIRLASTVAAGSFQGPDRKPSELFQKLPSFCRVTAELRPTADSLIHVEVWLPSPSTWNHRFQGEGNGGFAGAVNYNDIASALLRNYATASTDTGHEADGIDAAWALHHPEKITDFGNRAIHLMTMRAKAIVEAYYGSPAQHSYFVGCSNGGRQALMEAQRYPEDYNGILAGAPANNWTHMLTSGADVLATVLKTDAHYIPADRIPAIARAVAAACDRADGLADGILNNPRECRFNPAVLLCRGATSPECLTAPQVESLRKIYEGGKIAQGKQIFPGFLPGAEEGGGGWKTWVTGDAPGQGSGAQFTKGFFRYMVFDNPGWTVNSNTVDVSLAAAQKKVARQLDATDTDLSAFRKHGGKLILYHGWNDPAISALNTVEYYDAARSRMKPAEADDSIRLYMAPGMQHCFGGPGPNAFGQFAALSTPDPDRSMIAALERWVEKGTGPGTIQAVKYAGDNPGKSVQLTRPLCPYPQIMQYDGRGNAALPESFHCQATTK